MLSNKNKETETSMKDILRSLKKNMNNESLNKYNKSIEIENHRKNKQNDLNPTHEPSLNFKNSVLTTCSSKSSISDDENNYEENMKKINHQVKSNTKNHNDLLKISKKGYDDADEDEEFVYNNRGDQIKHSKNYNYNNNCNKNLKLRFGCDQTSDIEFLDNKPQFNNCKSETVKKKFNRANKIFYNGFLNKQDCSNMPEYQAHAAELLHFLKSLWVTNTMCDLSILIGGRKYPAHKIGLAMFSRKYRDEFQKLINSNKDSGIFTINLRNSTHLALESILKYIYTSKIDINPANVEEILEASKELGIDDLICMANDYLNSLSIGDVLDYMGNILNKEGSDLMFYELYSYIMTHLDKISRTPEYLKSNVFVIKTLLGDSHLKVASEIEVFDAALRWIDFDRQRRCKHLTEIMKIIRFTQMTPDELVSKVENLPIFTDNIDVFKMIYNSFKFHSLNNVNTKSKLTSFVKKEETRNICLKGASVPDDFVKSIIQLSDIAQKIKLERNLKTNDLMNQE